MASWLRGAVVSGGVVVLAASWPEAQQPTFRDRVDLVAIEAQVIDPAGVPVGSMAPTDFTVTVNGRRRRVASAEFLTVASRPDAAPTRSAPSASPAATTQAPNDTASRTFILAIDASSFEVGTAYAPVSAAQGFVNQLRTDDRIGLYVYPNGAWISPSTDRAAVRRRLASVAGDRPTFGGLYNLRASEIVDITGNIGGSNPAGLASRTRTARTATSAEIAANPVLGVQVRECPDDPECASRIVSEAHALALHLEGQATRSLGGLDTLLGALSQVPGRKIVLLVSAGVVVSDRPGGRPDVGELGRVMGQRAALANAVVYTVHIDVNAGVAYSAGRRRVGDVERDRDRAMTGDWLERFSKAAGGQRIHVPVGAGEFAFDQVLRETSGYYLLGVEAAEEDRDGRARELRVSLNRRGLTVRHRQWVVLPGR